MTAAAAEQPVCAECGAKAACFGQDDQAQEDMNWLCVECCLHDYHYCPTCKKHNDHITGCKSCGYCTCNAP